MECNSKINKRIDCDYGAAVLVNKQNKYTIATQNVQIQLY